MHTLAGHLHHLPTAAHTHAAQAYEGYLQSHVSNTEGAVIALVFIGLFVLLAIRSVIRSALRRN